MPHRLAEFRRIAKGAVAGEAYVHSEINKPFNPFRPGAETVHNATARQFCCREHLAARLIGTSVVHDDGKIVESGELQMCSECIALNRLGCIHAHPVKPRFANGIVQPGSELGGDAGKEIRPILRTGQARVEPAAIVRAGYMAGELALAGAMERCYRNVEKGTAACGIKGGEHRTDIDSGLGDGNTVKMAVRYGWWKIRALRSDSFRCWDMRGHGVMVPLLSADANRTEETGSER